MKQTCNFPRVDRGLQTKSGGMDKLKLIFDFQFIIYGLFSLGFVTLIICNFTLPLLNYY